MARKKLDEVELKSLLAAEIASAIEYDKDELASTRAQNIEYYRGEMNDAPAEANRSSVTSRDVADTIGWMLPGIIRVFTASDHMVCYEPEQPGDEEGAEQATDYVNFVFHKDNPGYRILWDATHDSLLQGNGIVKHWWDDKEVCTYSEHSGMTAEQLAVIEADQYAEIVEQQPGEPQIVEQIDPQTGAIVGIEIETFDVKVKRVAMNGRVRVECIAPEDFLIDRDATCIEDARFTAHRDEVTRSDLIEMGFDKEIVKSLPADRFNGLSDEKLAREEDYRNYNDTAHASMQLVELFECYIKVDVDGDGKAETIRAYYAGSQGAGDLLDWEVWDDDIPFSDIPCEPVPHRWDARSVADETKDIQRVKTALTRQMLDNLYWVNNPQTEAELDTVVNPEALTTPKFGGVVWRKKGTIATSPIKPLAVPFIGDKAIMGLQHFDNVREMRTGVSRSTMALDPEALQNQTATANQNQKDAAYSQVELIARNQAELGWRRVFRQLLKLIVKHQDRPRTIRLRDKWVEMDPRAWNANMDATINVGLGTGSRDRDMAMLDRIAQSQTLLIQGFREGGFMQEAIEMLPRLVETMKKFAESAGLKNPETYYPDMSPERVQAMMQQAAQMAQQPDPEIIKEQMKAETTRQVEAAKAEGQTIKERAQMEADLITENARLEADLMKDGAKVQFEREKFGWEMQMEERKLNQQRELELLKLGMMETGEGVKSKQDMQNEKQSEHNEMMAATLSKLTEAIKAIHEVSSAPRSIVRDPKTGRAMGVQISRQ